MPGSAEPPACSTRETDMSVAPEHYRAAHHALPRLPLRAIIVFAITGLGGALFLAYSSFSTPETAHSLVSASAAPAHEARAVPRDANPEEAAARAAAIARAIIATRSETQRSERGEPGREEGESSGSTLLSETNGELKGFSRFARVGPANNYLTLTGATFGMSEQMAPSGFFAPDAETIISAPVPEASTWLCGAALLALVVARGLHASWHRHQRRTASKSDSVRS
ncbi:MAG TPA: hypothetical protein VEX43_05480 [Chthoniobacterales bacterium]|nr:hypothetical protein [Chthoniobacterales bacterium]